MFEEPPAEWYAEPDVIGIDWEGQPPCLVQVACRHGVAVDVADAPWVHALLGDKRHEHVVFGAHEVARVPAGARNVQRDHRLSLAETLSRSHIPEVRLVKDPTIHKRVDWRRAAQERALTTEGAYYAALDAWATRKLALSCAG